MSIPSDDIDTGLSDFDAVAKLTQSLQGPSAPESDDEDDGDEDADDNAPAAPQGDDGDEEDGDEDDNSSEDEEENGEEDEDASKPNNEEAALAAVSDDAVVKVLVDGQETEFTVGNLKRLAGQEASLTKKSQEADLVGGRAASVLQGALEGILEDLAPYRNVDWVLEGQRMEPDEFAWHRETFNRLNARYTKIMGAAKDLEGNFATRRATVNAEAAQEAQRVLQADVSGWNDQLDQDVRAFAVAQGLDPEDVKGITSAPVLKIIHDAMRYRTQAKVTAEKVKQAPKAVRKGAGREPLGASAEKSQRDFAKKAASGAVSENDAVAALLGRWSVPRK